MESELQIIRELNTRGSFEEAEERSITLMRQYPSNHDFILEYAVACAKQLAFDKTIESTLRVIKEDTPHQWTHVNATRFLCIALAQLGQTNVALPFIKALSLSSYHAPNDRCWEGFLLLSIGKNEEALDIFNNIIKDLGPDPYTCMHRGRAMLSLGNASGFQDSLHFSSQEYWRLYYNHPYLEKIWESQPLNGKSIAVVPQGGYGDMFQFARYIPFLRALGTKEVIVICAPSCRQIMLSSGATSVLPTESYESVLNECDYWVPVFGLERMRLYGAPQSPQKPYLTPPISSEIASLISEISLKAEDKPRVGIYWHSDADGGEYKSLSLHNLLPLLSRQDIHWVIFQRGFGLRRLKGSGLDKIGSVMSEDLTFDQAAEVIINLDAIVSIDSWTIHLAAAMGVRTFLCAARANDARHENKEQFSVLYPGIATLARQPSCGDWRGAIEILNKDLNEWLNNRRLSR